MDDYKDLGAVARSFVKERKRRYTNAKNLEDPHLCHLLEDQEQRDVLGKILARHGHKRFKFVGNGVRAIALQTASAEVVRIEMPREPKARDLSRYTLQADSVTEMLIQDKPNTVFLQVEILPFVESLQLLRERGAVDLKTAAGIYDRLIVEMADKGIWSTDLVGIMGAMRLDNIGLLPNRTPIIIDPGSLLSRAVPGNKFIDGILRIEERRARIPLPIATQQWEWPEPQTAERHVWYKGICKQAPPRTSDFSDPARTEPRLNIMKRARSLLARRSP